jgi:uncharacterized protein involved in outer membrane biogenesis
LTTHLSASGRRPLSGRVGLKLIWALAFLFALLAVVWMLALPPAVAAIVRDRTGCGAEIAGLYANPFTGRFALHDLVLTNPPAFPRRDFVHVRELRIDARLPALVARRRVIDRAVLDIASLTIVRDRQGRVNVRLLERGLADAPANRAPAEDGPPRRGFLIRHLEVRLDRLVVADYAPGIPLVRELAVNFHHTYTDVTSARQLAAPLAAALGNFAGEVTGLLPEWDRTLKGFFESLEKSLKK